MSDLFKGSVLVFFMTLVFAVLFAALFAIAVMYLWNWLMPVIFGLCTITWLQAFGLTLLCRMLFGTGISSSTSKS